jgi:hypothetical protein
MESMLQTGQYPASGDVSLALAAGGLAGNVPPARVAAAQCFLALLELALAPLDRLDAPAELGLGGPDPPLAFGESAIVGVEPLLPRLELLDSAAEVLVVLPELALARRDCGLAPRQVRLGQQASVLGLLEAPDALVELLRVLVRRQEFLSRFGANLPERRLGAVELPDEVVDPGLSADVLRAELGQAALAVLDLGLLGLRLLNALTKLRFAALQVAVDRVEFRAPLVEHVHGAAQDVALDAAAKALAEAGVRVGHAAL